MVLGIFLGLLCGIPFILRIVHARGPLAVDASGTALVGHFNAWRVSTLTGRVGGVDTQTVTNVTVIDEWSESSGSYNRTRRTSTTVHKTLLVIDPAGQQHTLTLTNFPVEVFPDQIVSVSYAKRGRKEVVIAVLNHSTRRHFYEKRRLWTVVMPNTNGCLIVPAALLCAAIAGIAGGVGGVFFVMVAWLATALVARVATERQFRRFNESGLASLWATTGAVATPLLLPPPAA